jgi:hypothetical protein
MKVDSVVDQITKSVSGWPEVVAIAEGGSRVIGNADAASDVDLYIYVQGEISVDRRSALILARSDNAELDNRVWETSDEWTDRVTGIAVDMMYRSSNWIEGEVTQVLDQHKASLGYSTCLWHNVLTSRPHYDRNGWFAALQAKASQLYPAQLARAIVAKNYPLLREAHGAFAKQILRAARRGDIVSVNHRTAAFLASYFDVLFALNRVPHPGEKRLLKLAAQLPLIPKTLTSEVTHLLIAGVPCHEEELRTVLNRLVDSLDGLLSSANLSPNS